MNMQASFFMETKRSGKSEAASRRAEVKRGQKRFPEEKKKKKSAAQDKRREEDWQSRRPQRNTAGLWLYGARAGGRPPGATNLFAGSFSRPLLCLPSKPQSGPPSKGIN